MHTADSGLLVCVSQTEEFPPNFDATRPLKIPIPSSQVDHKVLMTKTT